MLVNNFTKFENDLEQNPAIKIVIIIVCILIGCCLCMTLVYRLSYKK
jgi:hypothetical protein